MSDTLFGRSGTPPEDGCASEEDEGGGDGDRVLGDRVDRERRPEEDEHRRSREQKRYGEAAADDGSAAARTPRTSQSTGLGYQRETLFSQSTALGRALRSGKLAFKSAMRRSISAGPRLVSRSQEDDVVLRRRRPDLPNPLIWGRDVARLSRGRDRLSFSGHGKLAICDLYAGALGLAAARGRCVERPDEKAAEIAGDPLRVGSRMGEHRLPADLGKPPVVVVPAPHTVGEAGEVLVHARAARGEELVEVDLVGAVRLEG